MSADKPLQDVYNTVRIPLTDSVIHSEHGDSIGVSGITIDMGLYWNCYPSFFSDRSQNQYSSQFDTWVQKRGPISSANLTSISNAVVPTANTTNPHVNMCITQMDDVYVAAIWDDTLVGFRIIQYKADAGSSLQIGQITAGTSSNDTIYLTELTVAGLPYLGVVWINATETSSLGAYAASNAGGTSFTAASLNVLSAGTDVSFPANLAGKVLRGPMVQMDGYTFVMTKQGGIYNSAINAITGGGATPVWNALAVVQSNAYPDQGVGLARYKQYIVAFNEDSIEFYTNVANAYPKSPIGRSEGAIIKFGCPYAKCYLTVDNNIFWWAKSNTANWGLFKLDGGFAPVKVSTLKEDLLAAKSSTYPELYILPDRGKQHLLTNIEVSPFLLAIAAIGTASPSPITLPTPAGFTSDPYSMNSSDFSAGWLCFDIQTGNSWVFAFSGAVALAFIRGFPLAAHNFIGILTNTKLTDNIILVSQDAPKRASGQVNQANGVYQNYFDVGFTGQVLYNDVSFGAFGAIAAGIQFNTWDFGNSNRKRIHRFQIVQRQYLQSTGNPTIAPWTWVVYNKSNMNLVNFGATAALTRIIKRPCVQNLSVARTYVNNLGASRFWTFAIAQKSDGPFSAKAIELNISQAG